MISIAVIIPVGPGHERHARRAVLSVRRQSVPAMPLVVNDSGQPIAIDTNAERVTTSGAQGVGYARQLGTTYTRAWGYDMVCYLDADDILMPRALEAMLRTYVARPASYVYGDGYNLRGGVATYYRADEYDRAIYGRRNIHNVTALIPTDIALAGEWTNKHWEDYLFYCSLALRGYCGVRAPYPVIAYDLAAGYRRVMATNEGAGYANGLAAEYQTKFSSGGVTMGCCSTNGPLVTSAAAMLEAAPGVEQPDGTVAMAYSGDQAGGVSYNINGRRYRGKVGGVVYAHPDDVEALERIGVFYRVPATPDGEQAIKLAEEYNALVLGSPPGAALGNDAYLRQRDGSYDAEVNELVRQHSDAKEAELNRLFDADPLTTDAAGNVLAQVDTAPSAYRAHRIDGGENGVLGSPPPPRLPLGDAEDDGGLDTSASAAPPADTAPAAKADSAEDDDGDGDDQDAAPAKPRRGRKPKADQK